MKFGETTRGVKRYTKKFLNENHLTMDFIVRGTKKEMHDWQHYKIIEYKNTHDGIRPKLNKSDW